ncbi:MAG: hypothetical protein WKG00_35740 [Polyangiaceae bacterium]
MSTDRIRFAAVLFVVAVGACHFDDSFQIDASVDPGRPGAEFREACTEQAAGSCGYLARCYTYYFEQGWPDLATCIDRRMLGCQLRASDPDASRDDDSIRACALPADFPCSSDPAYEAASAELRERCPDTGGDLPNGTECQSPAACASGICTKDDHADRCGTCRPDPCAACTEDQRCLHYVDDTVTCITVQEDGASCTEGLTCTSTYCKDFVCASPPDEGEACEPVDGRCEASAQVALFCNASTLRCERVALLKAGENCEASASGAVACGGGSSCLPHGGTMTCVDPAADGAACFASQGLGCLWPAQCIDGFCRFQVSRSSCSQD